MNELNKIKSLIDNIVIKNSIESWEACKFLDILFVVQKCEETLSKRKIYYYLEFLAKNGLLKKTPSPTKRNRYIYTETIQLKALRKARENDLIQKNQSQEREIICKNINSIENTILDLQRITDDLPYNLKNILKVFNKILEEEIIRLNERLKRI